MESEPILIPNITFSDGVIREFGTNKLTLIGTFHGYTAANFPFKAPPFAVTVALSNLRGKMDHFKVSVRVEDKSSGLVLGSAAGEINSINELKPTDTVQIPFGISLNPFLAAGLYNVVVLAQGEPIGSRDLVVNAASVNPTLPNV